MSILSSIYRHTLARVIPSSPGTEDGTTRSKKRKIEDIEDKEAVSRRRKRQSSDEEVEVITKRRRIDNDHFAPIVDGEAYESTAIAGEQTHHNDRSNKTTMVPPDALNASKIRPISKMIKENGKRRTSLDNMDAVSQLSVGLVGSQQRVSGSLDDEYNMEKARRHAAATDLPPNSGIWERGEKELFFHLSYRGFEPLFPANWMRDFRTMPLSLYYQPDDEEPPLIQHRKLGEFRAIRELRELLELGKNVRDQALCSPGVRREGIIEKATNKYIAWAIRDVGIQLLPLNTTRSRNINAVLPIHVVIKLKARQTTTDCLMEMKNKLHDLAARHRRMRNIHTSIERDELGYGTPNSNDETRIADSLDEDLPVLYGIMICKSVLAVFTLNSRTPPFSPPKRGVTQSARTRRYRQSPTPLESNARGSVTSTEANTRMKKSILLTEQDEQDEFDSASDPRFISDFDFSESTKDVWNALVIAIVAMQIRRDLILLQESADDLNMNDNVQRGIEDMDIDEITDDDPDA